MKRARCSGATTRNTRKQQNYPASVRNIFTLLYPHLLTRLMSQDKESEIRLQFLDEAQEYLGTLETAMLGLASGIDIDKINASLRAAHSIKGGAAMMGFQTLSEFAHRLEDSFKVLKVQKNSVEVDPDLEQLLLTGVDCLQQVLTYERQAIGIDPHWLETQANPVFERLYERLGEPQAEDAHSMLSPEDGHDIIPLLFQTEVEGCLQRLESVLEEASPCLKEEVDILAQELGGLGEMLQLNDFSQLCLSVAHHLAAAAPEQVEVVAHSALEIWRRTQALVLTGNLTALPTTIEIPGLTPITHQAIPTPSQASQEPLPELVEPAELAQFDIIVEGAPAEILPNIAATEMATDITLEEAVFDIPVESTQPDSPQLPQPVSASETVPELETFTVSDTQPISGQEPNPDREARTGQFQFSQDSTASIPEDTQENTVRVPVKQLNGLNDLFGELTIERNRLDLEVKRLRNLIRTLSRRVQVLDDANNQLRSAYDKVATQTNPLTKMPLLLPAAEANVHPPTAESLPIAENIDGVTDIHSQFDVLEMDHYKDVHLPFQEVMETIVQLQEVTSDIELELDSTEQTSRNLKKTYRQLQTGLTKLRMRPLSDIADRFPRALRELSLQHGKPVELKVSGGSTLVDRNILEALNDPLMHLIRNSFDHGIENPDIRRMQGKPEQGRIEIRASHRSNRTVISIHDDGSGISLDKIRDKARQMGLDEMLLAAASDQELLSLIFEPGFSTADQVTDLSGRGVGMDVVRNNLKQIRGDIRVDTQDGIGTTFTISVPFTLSVTRALLVESHSMLMAFPIDVIEEMFMLPPEKVMTTAGSEVFEWEGVMVQLIRLSDWLTFNCARQIEPPEALPTISVPTVLMVRQNDQLVGIQISKSWGEQEIAIRKVEGGLPMPAGFNNCTILGDGQVVPIVNVPELLHWIASCESAQTQSATAIVQTEPHFSSESTPLSLQPATPTPLPPKKPTILIVDDSINVRRLLALTLEKAGYQVAQAKDGQDALDKLVGGLEPQAVICDIEMPRLDGFGFLAQIRTKPALAHLPIAMLTSRSGDKHRQLAMTLGAAAYFSKPYNEQILLKTLAQLIEPALVS